MQFDVEALLNGQSLLKTSPDALTADFIRSQANLSSEQASKQKTNQLDSIVVKMPVHFASKGDFISKLIELVVVEAECEKLNTEMIAAKNIPFFFEERLEIFSRLQL